MNTVPLAEQARVSVRALVVVRYSNNSKNIEKIKTVTLKIHNISLLYLDWGTPEVPCVVPIGGSFRLFLRQHEAVFGHNGMVRVESGSGD